jgi:hypothetical protein
MRGEKKRRSAEIDLALEVARALTPPGARWSISDLAYVCGCSPQAIWFVEQQALKKLRAALARRGVKEFPC